MDSRWCYSTCPVCFFFFFLSVLLLTRSTNLPHKMPMLITHSCMSQCPPHITCFCAYFLGPSGSSTISSSSFTSSSTLFTFSRPSTLISATSVSFLGVFSFSFLSFCLGGALRFGFGTSLENKDSRIKNRNPLSATVLQSF